MMKSLLQLILISILALSFAAIGCDKKEEKTDETTEKSDAEIFVSLFEEMADIVDTNKGNCDKMGEALQAFADDNGEEVEKLSKNLKKASKEEEEELEKKFGDRMKEAQEKMMDSLMECVSNDKVGSAMKSIKL